MFHPVCINLAGVGALFVRRRPRVRLEPIQNGGGQERGMRSGTVPTPLAVGLGAACRIAQAEMAADQVYRFCVHILYVVIVVFNDNNVR